MSPMAEELSSLTINALKARLCDQGLSTFGIKATLIIHLSQHMCTNPAALDGPSAIHGNDSNDTQGSNSTGTQCTAINAT